MIGDDRWRSLGTLDGDVEIVDYRRSWPAIFECQAKNMLNSCGNLITAVHHIGGTSVAGLASKPILDMMPIVANRTAGFKAIAPMEKLGYRYRGENGIAGRLYFDMVVECRTVAHVHMFSAGHPDIRKHLFFRDYLRTHPETAMQYERLKRSLASQQGMDRRSYTDAKSDFINQIIGTATGSVKHSDVESKE